ncbi:MAG TPA: hypothetical protein VFK05_07950 [Polyangiaceae bacterium]|nr:hypothetical protein [Polyangiaceae bacterium]
MRRSSTSLARFARRCLVALWSMLLVVACFELIDLPSSLGADACDASCTECPAEKSGRECPLGCPECHAHQGHLASLPGTPSSSLEASALHVSEVCITPLEAATPQQRFLPSIYRPPRARARS